MSENISATETLNLNGLPLSLDNVQPLRAFLELISDFVAYVDRTGKIRFANHAFVRAWQKSAQEIEGSPLQEILNEDFLAVAQPHLEKALAGERVTFMAHIARPVFQPHWIKVTLAPDRNAQGTIQGCFFILNGIDATPNSEELLLIKDRLSLAIEASDIGIWDYIPETNQLNWSDKQQALYGLAPGSFRNSYEHYQELLHPEDRDFVNRIVETAINGRKSYTVTHRVIWPDGSVHWTQGRGKPFFDYTGKMARITGTTISIDERKRFESELNRAIQSRDDFISIASHELKTPLTSLKLQTDIIRRATRKDPAFQLAPERILKLADQMDQQIQRLTRLVDDMLDASRVSSGKLSFHFASFNLSTLLNEISSRFASRFQQANIAFRLNAQAEIEIYGDADRLEQVISNLYTNAIRYAAGSQLETSMQLQEGEIQIQVKDSGPGISLEAQKRIFSRFERADAQNKAPGLGLGLYISKQIIEGHAGSIQVDSSPGKGASFTLRLPLKSD